MTPVLQFLDCLRQVGNIIPHLQCVHRVGALQMTGNRGKAGGGQIFSYAWALFH